MTKQEMKWQDWLCDGCGEVLYVACQVTCPYCGSKDSHPIDKTEAFERKYNPTDKD